jgi:hypothetical protein
MEFLFPVLCVGLIGAGIYLMFDNTAEPGLKSPSGTTDTSIARQMLKVDTVGKSISRTTIDSVISRRTEVNVVPAKEGVSSEKLLKSGYDLIFLGIILLLIFYALPNLSEFNILSLASAKFREVEQAVKKSSNENTSAAMSGVPAQGAATTEQSVSEEKKQQVQQKFQNNVGELNTMVAYTDDPQKNKWGKRSYRNSRVLTAMVDPLGTFNDQRPLFKIRLKVRSDDPRNPLTGSVIFHLHPSFVLPDPEIFVINGEASLDLTAWGAFTVGVEADKGMTKLELDLAELPDAPLVFKTS